LAAVCEKHGIKLILNLGDSYGVMLNGKPLAEYAWGAAFDLTDGCLVSAGEGGAFVYSEWEAYAPCHARHNCGRALGEGATLQMGAILGSNTRITEWQAGMAGHDLRRLDGLMSERKAKARAVTESLNHPWLAPLQVIDGGVPALGAIICRYDKTKNSGKSIDEAAEALRQKGFDARRPWKAMHRQPVFASAYFRKATGRTGGYGDAGLENSIEAEETLIWIKEVLCK
jgi:dTDP-4-amino-4,6-dideoxygalactose transaminase